MLKSRVSPRDTCKHCGKSFATRYTRKKHEETGVCQKGDKECEISKSSPVNVSDVDVSAERIRSEVGKLLIERAMTKPSVASARVALPLMSKAERIELKSKLLRNIDAVTYKWVASTWYIIQDSKMLIDEIKNIAGKYSLLKEDGTWGTGKKGHYVLLSKGIVIEPAANDIMINSIETFMTETKRKTNPLPEHNRLATQLLYGEPEPLAYKEWKAYKGFYNEAVDDNGRPKMARLDKNDLATLEYNMASLRKNINTLSQIGNKERFFEFTVARFGIGVHASTSTTSIFTTDSTPVVSMAGPLPTEKEEEETGMGAAKWFTALVRPEPETSSERRENKRLGFPEGEYISIRDPYKRPDPEFIRKMVSAVVLLGVSPSIPEKVSVYVMYPKNAKTGPTDTWKGFEKEADGVYNEHTSWTRLSYKIPKEVREFAREQSGGRRRRKPKAA